MAGAFGNPLSAGIALQMDTNKIKERRMKKSLLVFLVRLLLTILKSGGGIRMMLRIAMPTQYVTYLMLGSLGIITQHTPR